MLAYNLLSLMRLLALAEMKMHRIRAIRWRVDQLSGKVVNSGRRLLLKVREKRVALFEWLLKLFTEYRPPHGHGYSLGVDTQQKSAFICAVTGSAGVLLDQIGKMGLIVGYLGKRLPLTCRF